MSCDPPANALLPMDVQFDDKGNLQCIVCKEPVLLQNCYAFLRYPHDTRWAACCHACTRLIATLLARTLLLDKC